MLPEYYLETKDAKIKKVSYDFFKTNASVKT